VLKIGKRKIQQIRTAQYINLPKVWTENNHTEKGDVVDIELTENGSLTLRLAPAEAAKQTTGAATTSEEQAEACQ